MEDAKGVGPKRRAGEKGRGAGKKEKGSFLPVFFLFALSQFYGPDYLGAWNHVEHATAEW